MSISESPLKRLERPTEFKSRFTTDFERLLSGPSLADTDNTSSFFADLFCLEPKPDVVERLVEQQTASRLLARRTHLGLFFRSAIGILKESQKDDVRRLHALECLLPFMRQLLKKPFPNYNFDLISILCGSLEQSDLVLSNFVATLDETLRDESCQPLLRRRALQIILVMACQIGQGSLVSYFLRRDFFFTLCGFITKPETPEMQIEAQLLLGVLANYHKFETRNLYLVRLEDLVEDQVMRTVISSTTRALQDAQQAYVEVEDDAPPSFVATLTSLVSSLRLSEYFSNSNTSPTKGSTSAGEKVFRYTPPPEAVLLLLPFYDLYHRNKLFFSLTLEPEPAFTPTFLSFASYALCHASTSARAKSYSRLCLISMTRLVEEGTVTHLAHREAQVRLCRQRKPQLPFVNDQRRPLLCALLDNALVYLRHNIQKQLDVESYLLGTQLLHKVLHGLKTARIRLEYDWVPLWRVLIALGTFIVHKMEQLKSLPGLDTLVAQILITLDYACLHSDVLFAQAQDSTMLFYEVLRAENVINQLGDFTGASGLSLRSSTSSSHSTPPATSGSAADQSVRNLKAVVAHFSTALEEHGDVEHLEAEEVLEILERSAGEGLDLVESTALEAIRAYDEVVHEASFKLLLREAMQDALEFTSSENSHVLQ